MISGFRLDGGGLTPADGLDDAIWIDLLEPDDAERAQISALIGAEVPVRADQEEIELSSRLYFEQGAAVMTALLPASTEKARAEIAPVSFILTTDRLVTVRHHRPRPFETFPQRAGKLALPCTSSTTVLIGLLEDIIDRLADITEVAGRRIDALSAHTFESEKAADGDFRGALKEIGRLDGRVAQLRDCLITTERLLGFLGTVMDQQKPGREAKSILKTQVRDVRTISEQTAQLMQKTAFLLDATLGLISVEQNAIIKIFSVVAVVFLPPTLVASIYGMNFEVMPELSWPLGYPAALFVMFVSAAAPLLYFRRKGWF
ncbi:magnesium transporter CorA family protein [Pikeienuella piscinae]|uniref:Magnesium transport protein CorA n=1 Tax=Pikeienuella piscinae TaxID=2748098 RepID=A0A7L5BXB3_9RHOB|nr:magnesium transporter CorA family protein [Pikeienuella piscinae]QIE55167.1 magnesium transporter CorA family protein [Pikeienuella piscinae]